MSQQWLAIFNKLPIGMMITKKNKVVHSNNKMHEILGEEEIINKDIEEFDKSFFIQDDESL